MKKLFFGLFVIILTTTSAFALIDHYKTIEPGEYTCPEAEYHPCIVNKYKTGEVHFSSDCEEGKTSKTSKYAPMIKRGECKVAPDPGQYFICEYADSKCFVYEYGTRNKISCTYKKKAGISAEQRKNMSRRVRQDALAGNCRPMYPEEKTQSE